MISRSQTDQTLENQNEAELNSLHGKIKALRHVRVGGWGTMMLSNSA